MPNAALRRDRPTERESHKGAIQTNGKLTRENVNLLETKAKVELKRKLPLHLFILWQTHTHTHCVIIMWTNSQPIIWCGCFLEKKMSKWPNKLKFHVFESVRQRRRQICHRSVSLNVPGTKIKRPNNVTTMLKTHLHFFSIRSDIIVWPDDFDSPYGERERERKIALNCRERKPIFVASLLLLAVFSTTTIASEKWSASKIGSREWGVAREKRQPILLVIYWKFGYFQQIKFVWK